MLFLPNIAALRLTRIVFLEWTGTVVRVRNNETDPTTNGMRAIVYQDNGTNTPVETSAVAVHTIGPEGERKVIHRSHLTVLRSGDECWLRPTGEQRVVMKKWPRRRIAISVPLDANRDHVVHVVNDEAPVRCSMQPPARRRAGPIPEKEDGDNNDPTSEKEDGDNDDPTLEKEEGDNDDGTPKTAQTTSGGTMQIELDAETARTSAMVVGNLIFLSMSDNGPSICGKVADSAVVPDTQQTTLSIDIENKGDGLFEIFVQKMNAGETDTPIEVLLHTVDSNSYTVDHIHIRSFHLWKNLNVEIIPVFVDKLTPLLRRINKACNRTQNIILHYIMVMNGVMIGSCLRCSVGKQDLHGDVGSKKGAKGTRGEVFDVVVNGLFQLKIEGLKQQHKNPILLTKEIRNECKMFYKNLPLRNFHSRKNVPIATYSIVKDEVGKETRQTSSVVWDAVVDDHSLDGIKKRKKANRTDAIQLQKFSRTKNDLITIELDGITRKFTESSMGNANEFKEAERDRQLEQVLIIGRTRETSPHCTSNGSAVVRADARGLTLQLPAHTTCSGHETRSGVQSIAEHAAVAAKTVTPKTTNGIGINAYGKVVMNEPDFTSNSSVRIFLRNVVCFLSVYSQLHTTNNSLFPCFWVDNVVRSFLFQIL